MTTPPIATKKPVESTIHGHTRVDNYAWLREKESPEVIAYLEAENEYTKTVMAHTEELQKTLYDEMLGRIQETDLSVPVKKGDYYYYTRTEEGQQYPIYCRKQGSLEADEQILLDLNVEAEGQEYLELGIYVVSPDHNLLAYGLDTTGYEEFTIRIKDLTTGILLPDVIENTTWTLEWSNDNKAFFYTTHDQAKRPHKIHRHLLGTSSAEDVEVYHEPNELFRSYVTKTKDEQYILIQVGSIETTEVHVLSADTPLSDFAVVHPRQKGMKYSLEHREGTYYILTNDDAKNFKLMIAAVETPTKEHWRELIPHREQVKIDDMDMFAEHLVLYERENGLKTIQVRSFANEVAHNIAFPEPVYTYRNSSNPEYNSHLLRFTYMSLTTPDSIYDYDMNTRERDLKKKKPVLGGFDANDYQSERIFATAKDGTKIPVSLVYKKGMVQDGSHPCLLYAYGSYGLSTEPWFQSNIFSLVDRGFIFAMAHIRGGQEMGRYWYDQGKFLNKMNTFTDFIACGEALVAGNYTSHDKLAIRGGSAGGLLMGAVLNMAPHLAKVATALVPFVDVVNTMLDESIPLTVGEFEEWGNPKDEEYYHYMLSYSPYDNVKAKAYPNILVTAGLNDPRVHYWEPAKWTAKLRDMKTDDNRLLLKTNMGAGHRGASGRYDYLKEVAFDYAFILDTLGITQ